MSLVNHLLIIHTNLKIDSLVLSKKAIVMQYNKDDAFTDDINPNHVYTNIILPRVMNTTPDANNPGVVSLAANTDKTSFGYRTRVPCNYYQSIEGYSYINPRHGRHGTFINQPQAHIGLLATPSLNPAKENTNFLNSSIYTVSDAEIIIEFDMESMCTDHENVNWPETLTFLLIKKMKMKTFGEFCPSSPRHHGGRGPSWGVYQYLSNLPT